MKTKIKTHIDLSKILYGNYTKYLHNISYNEFIKLVKLVPNISVVDNKILNKGKNGYFYFVMKSFYNMINNQNENNRESLIKRFFKEDYDRIKENIIEYSLLNEDLSRLKFSFNNINEILNNKNITETVYDIWLKLKNELIENDDYLSIYEDNKWLVVIILNHNEYCKLVNRTNFCTKIFYHFYDYCFGFRGGPLYLLIPKIPKKWNELYQFHFESNQYMDNLDNPINKLNSCNSIISKVEKNHNKNLLLWNQYKNKIQVSGFGKKNEIIYNYMKKNNLISYLVLKLKNNKLFVYLLNPRSYRYDETKKLLSEFGSGYDIELIYNNVNLKLLFHIKYNNNNLYKLFNHNLIDDKLLYEIVNNDGYSYNKEIYTKSKISKELYNKFCN